MRFPEQTARRLSDYLRAEFDTRAWSVTLSARDGIGSTHEFGDAGTIELSPEQTRRLYEHLADMYGDGVERRLVGVEKPSASVPKSGVDWSYEKRHGGNADAD